MVNGDRVKQARELRGLTQTELAERVGAVQATMAHVEGGRSQPSPELLDAIALQTGFPLAFFRRETAVDFPLGSLLFRARSSMKSRERSRVHRYAELMFEMAETMADRVKGPSLRLPRSSDDPITAARITRASLGLSPDAPIPNLINVAEKAGVLVLVLPDPMEGGDAFSVWPGLDTHRPVVVVSGHAPGDRQRLSVAHEIGHLVMHQPPRGASARLEQEAYRFAAELLMPEAAMREEIVSPATLSGLAAMKPRWRVSIQALVRRARDLELLSERQYRYLFEQISTRGWRTREPANLDVPAERPRAVRKMAELLYGEPIDYERLAADVNLPAQLVRKIVGAHAGRDGRAEGGVTASDLPKLLPFDAGRRASDYS